MALVSISEAARLAGIARSHFYKAYVDTGKISISKDSQGNRKIDTSEIMRVFGVLAGQSSSAVVDTLEKTKKTEGHTGQEEVIALLKQQLQEVKQEAAEREQWYRQQIGELTSTIKLLEHQNSFPFWQKWFK